MTTVTIEGRLGADPELKYTAAGKPVCSFPVVSSRNHKDDAGNWNETETTWRRVTCWDGLAENVTESVRKGDQVVLTGREYMEEYETNSGEKRTSLKVTAYTVGADLKRSKWQKNRTERPTGKPANDPWQSGPAVEAPF
jgi:single-strand DNA-binding protein